MILKLSDKQFYVRDCYKTYYDYISEILLTKEECSNIKGIFLAYDGGTPKGFMKVQYISVTGTPGIGKSIFYIYFFERFRKDVEVWR